MKQSELQSRYMYKDVHLNSIHEKISLKHKWLAIGKKCCYYINIQKIYTYIQSTIPVI